MVSEILGFAPWYTPNFIPNKNNRRPSMQQLRFHQASNDKKRSDRRGFVRHHLLLEAYGVVYSQTLN